MATWNVDTAHSQVTFSVRHMVFAKVRGSFAKWNATLALDDADLTKSRVEVSIDATSIDTHEEKRDAHLRSADFLDTEHHKELVFESTRVERDGDRYKMIGELTIRGTTKEVALDVELTGRGKDPWGNERTGFSATTTINRTDWGLKWNQGLEAGGLLVGEKVEITIDLQAVKAA